MPLKILTAKIFAICSINSVLISVFVLHVIFYHQEVSMPIYSWIAYETYAVLVVLWEHSQQY